jgi:hypothetical protein
MRDFSWQYFSLTGDVDAYLLFKEFDRSADLDNSEEDFEDEPDVIV